MIKFNTLKLSEDALLIFRDEDGLIQLLDTTAHLFWQASQLGLDAEAIHTALPDTIDKPSVIEIQRLQNQWLRIGLLETFPTESSFILCIKPGLHTITLKTNHLQLYRYLHLAWETYLDSATCSLHNNVLSIRYLETEDVFLLTDLSSAIPIVCSDINMALTQSNMRISHIAFHEKPSAFFAHAAALRSPNGKVLILPAAAGSGKSTLTATLLKNGYQLINDDVVPVNHDGSVSAINTPLKIKSGAWALIGKLYPQLEAMPTIERQDGIHLKYLPITAEKCCPPGSTYPVDLLISPQYAPNLTPHSIRLTSSQALAAILSANPSFPHTFSSDYFQQIVDWVSSLQAFNLRYRDSQEALLLLEQLLMGDDSKVLQYV